MPGAFPLPSPPTTPPTTIILSDDEEDDNCSEVTETHKEDDDVLYTTTNKISLTNRDLQTLQPGKWLNDTIIDFTLKTIEDKYRCSDYISVSSSFFFTRLKSAKAKGVDIYNETKAWISCKKLRQSRTWFIPVCQDYHWFLIAVVFPGKTRSLIYIMDSLNRDRRAEAELVIEFIESFHLVEARSPLRKIPEIYQHKIPQQHNMNDCGLHLIRSFELSIVRRKFIIRLMQGEVTNQAEIDAFWQEYPVISRHELEYQLLKYALERSTS
ncbi:hypothetical protein V8B55DRAFT_1432641 [Mucor lusitanicus]|uniref:Ubiquitin-like protease family profile domain-containing protein n=2 Tax=Mucor circinelloides f. lusitanicus TaxID=29924 RepID=A0A168PN36_MUCCL|nr:hypothetical protein FB192DRAFT_1446895 [Mucor lusitanicus]OAD07961.1 hypothetical protein MUCCIDRAFT_104909 [Mucor lusitanicus CBS 277.49]